MIPVTVLSVLNLLLLLVLLRRVNELAGRRPAGAAPAADPFPAAGTRIAPFASVDVDGLPLRDTDLAKPTLVGFFGVGCPPCDVLLPDFQAHAGGFPGGRDRVLAVVAGDSAGAEERAAALVDACRVVVEPYGGPLTTAFGVDEFPFVCIVDDGELVAANVKIGGQGSG